MRIHLKECLNKLNHLSLLQSSFMENTELLYNFVSAFEILQPEEIQMIVDNANIQEFKKGTILLAEGEISKSCYFVLRGCVREYYLKDGEEKTTAFYTEYQPVTSFTSYTAEKPSKHFWVCAEDCILTVGSQALEDEMIKRIPRLERVILQEVERNTGKAQDEWANFMTSTPEERYVNILENRPELLHRIPQHQIASYIGIKPESLSRIRKRMVQS